MATVKHTKNELKAQRDALKRFQRYLPTLQLKKQQLQAEVRRIEATIEEVGAQLLKLMRDVERWRALFAEEVDLDHYLELQSIRESVGNIAGVTVPVLQDALFRREEPDPFDTPAWLDEGLELLEEATRRWVEIHILHRQQQRLSEELRTTSQRVNLFEKVKIPESRRNIRVIRIFLGDQQTAEVGRAKIAKRKAERSA